MRDCWESTILPLILQVSSVVYQIPFSDYGFVHLFFTYQRVCFQNIALNPPSIISNQYTTYKFVQTRPEPAYGR